MKICIRIVTNRIFSWSCDHSLTCKILISFLFALATAYGAQLRIPLPWSPVPITLQTFFVLLSGLLMGPCWGAVSQAIYVGVGICGLPFFTGMLAGWGRIFGPTGGYLMSYILVSFVVGLFSKRILYSKSSLRSVLLLSLLSLPIVYGLGCTQLAVWLSVNGSFPGLFKIFTMGMFPFLIGDLIKIFMAVLVGRSVHRLVRFFPTPPQSGW